MEAQTFFMERTYDAPASDVWKALTQVEYIRKWFFDMPSFIAHVGFEFSFDGTGTCEKPNIHVCKVTDVVPGQRLSYTWGYEGYEGISQVTFELFEVGQGTRLKLTHAGLENFSESLRQKKKFSEGWTIILGTNLKKFLENQH